MTSTRRNLLDWAERGLIAETDLHRALTLVEVLPSQDRWRYFLDRLLLWMGTMLVAAGLIFFLAYNWKDLGGFAKFGLAEALVIISLGFLWNLGLDRPGGKAALLGASLFLGALLAVIGQTYQTGADTFELFGIWAAMILPWVVVSQFAALWLLWLVLINVAILLYLQIFPSVFGLLFSMERMPWALFGLNTLALAIWEAAAAGGVEWLRPRWAPRLVASASCGFATTLATTKILALREASSWGIPLWFAWLVLAWAVYRRLVKDVFMLAAGALSLIIVVSIFFTKHLSDSSGAGFFMVGLLVITLSAAAGWWLKQVVAEDET